MHCRRELPPQLEQQVMVVKNNPPMWDDKLRAYTLDFKGRVREPSARNFQLVPWDLPSNRLGQELVALSGKTGPDTFCLDFAWPLSPLQAFGAALATLDSKLCHVL